MRRLLVLLGLLSFLTGCLPIELDVSKDGKILIPRQEGYFVLDPATSQATKVSDPIGGGQCMFARFTPDGKNILAVSTQSNNMQLYMVDRATKQSQSFFSASNCTYITCSPTGKHVAVASVADSQSGGFDQNLPELKLIDTATKSAKAIASNVSSLHRWTSDGKAIITVQLKSKVGDTSNYAGELVSIDVASGKATSLCKLGGPDGMFMDISPDGKTVLFTALAAGSMSDTVNVPEKDDKMPLFQLDIAGGKVKQIYGNIAYAIFSPDGKKVLIGSKPDREEMMLLQVADANFAGITTIAQDAADSAGGMGNDAKIYPGWVDNNTVHYLATRSVYGTAGKNLMLMTVSADGKTVKPLQSAIDTAAMK